MNKLLQREINKEPIELDKQAIARIVNMELLDIATKQFAITFEILDGYEIGTLIRDDKFHAHPECKYHWRYVKLLRAVANDDYKKDSEDFNVDLEKILLDKCIYVKLSIYKTENRLGKELQFQNIDYSLIPFTKDIMEKVTSNYELWKIERIRRQKEWDRAKDLDIF